MTIKSQPLDFAVSIIAVAGCAFGTCKSSADIPICSAIARASSSTLPARSLQAALKRSTISCEGIHPEACPLKISAGSRSVTVMTVALAFKAFAKAIPCLTPFLAPSDPSVLKRILAYIQGLPCSSTIFPKKAILTYMVRSSPSVSGPFSKLIGRRDHGLALSRLEAGERLPLLEGVELVRPPEFHPVLFGHSALDQFAWLLRYARPTRGAAGRQA